MLVLQGRTTEGSVDMDPFQQVGEHDGLLIGEDGDKVNDLILINDKKF